MSEFMTVSEAAERLGASTSFIQRRCKDGSIPCMRIGKTYRIRSADLEAFSKVATQTATRGPAQAHDNAGEEVLNLIDAWFSYATHVRALAPSTLDLYRVIIRTYLRRMAAIGDRALTIESLFERKTVLAVFSQIPAKSFNTKQNTYIVLKSFGRFLLEENKLPKPLVDDLRLLKPRRQSEPRRTHLKPLEAQRLFEITLTRRGPIRDNLTIAAIIACMVYGGLRVSEVCNLRRQDVDVAARVLTVRHGKGGKDRRVGINCALLAYLADYERVRPAGNSYFVQTDGTPFDRNKVGKRVKRISNVLGVDITPHGLRRTFATVAAAQGRSVDYLRIALGHANLETTQAYLRTSEAEVIEAMKAW